MEKDKGQRPGNLEFSDAVAPHALSVTTRERQILSMAAEGLTDKQIGQDLGISRDTVATYWRRLFAKLGASSRSEAIAKVSADLLSVQNSRFEAAERGRRLLSCLSDPALYRISSRSMAVESLNRLLDRLLGVLDCEYGFIGEVLLDDTAPYLLTHAISDNSWDESTRRLYEQHLAFGLEFRNLDTPFGVVMVSQQAMFFNDATAIPSHWGIPGGNPPLRQFLGIPLIVGGQMVGMICLGNKEGGFSQQTVDFLAPVVGVCSAIILSLRSQMRQEETQRELAATQSRLRVLLDEVAEGIVLIDKDRLIQYSNASFKTLFRRAPDSPTPVGLDCKIAVQKLSLHFQDSQAFVDSLEHGVTTGEAFEESLLLTDGRRVNRRFRPMYLEGELEGYFSIYRLEEEEALGA